MSLFTLDNVKVDGIFEIKHLKLKQNKVTCITGQSGSGKSTLLRLFNRLDDPDNGEIYMNGQPITNLNPLQLRSMVIMVPQTPVIFDGTIRDNLQIGLTFIGTKAADDNELKNILDILALDKALDQNAEDLSGGEKQRLALGRVMLMDSAMVYLLDEPSSALDDETTERVIGAFIRNAQKNGRSVVMVSHDKTLTEQFAEEKMNMDNYSLVVHKKKGDTNES